MTVLYRKYRPQKLSDLIGQDNIKDTLTVSLKNGKMTHAYLFTGPKGTGKTTTARILAKMLNCEKNVQPVTDDKKHIDDEINSFDEPCNECGSCVSITEGSSMDVLEIDAASNRGIDDIRGLKERIKLAPVAGKFKVYIIDEVHMLTSEAFNALLKTLEEPPSHSVFILCTTDPKKVPDTISSRCQKFEFKKAKNDQIVSYLKKISAKEKINCEEKALMIIARNSTGGFRDAVSLFDQIASSASEITVDTVLSRLSLSDETSLNNFLGFLKEKNAGKSLELISDYVDSGKDIYSFVRDLLVLLEKLIMAKMGIVDADYDPDLPLEELKDLAGRLSKCEAEMKFAFLSQLPLEILVIDWCGVSQPGVPSPVKKDPEKTEKNLLAGKNGEKTEDTEIKTEKPLAKSQAVYQEEYTALTLESINQKWPEVLSALKPFNHSLESLLRKCEMSDFDGKTLSMAAFYKLHKDVLMDPKNLRIINECLTKVIGEDINLMVGIKPRPETKSEANLADSELASAAEKLFG